MGTLVTIKGLQLGYYVIDLTNYKKIRVTFSRKLLYGFFLIKTRTEYKKYKEQLIKFEFRDIIKFVELDKVDEYSITSFPDKVLSLILTIDGIPLNIRQRIKDKLVLYAGYTDRQS